MSASPEAEEPKYRAMLINQHGMVVSTVRIAAGDDAKAREKAKALVDGHAVDLCDGRRFVDHFPAAEERL